MVTSGGATGITSQLVQVGTFDFETVDDDADKEAER